MLKEENQRLMTVIESQRTSRDCCHDMINSLKDNNVELNKEILEKTTKINVLELESASLNLRIRNLCDELEKYKKDNAEKQNIINQIVHVFE
jgi:chromosome segregation ATPase